MMTRLTSECRTLRRWLPRCWARRTASAEMFVIAGEFEEQKPKPEQPTVPGSRNWVAEDPHHDAEEMAAEVLGPEDHVCRDVRHHREVRGADRYPV